MSSCEHVTLMARYNAWMNLRLYQAAARLSAAQLAADRKAFFGSILGTLNHLVVADIIWLKRFATLSPDHAALDPVRRLPAPAGLDTILFTDFSRLFEHRKMLDGAIVDWAEALTETDLAQVLHYANTKGVESDQLFSSLVVHFFNHQTHHRGQVSTLLFQAGVDVGVTDLLELIPQAGGRGVTAA
jgi:uncharacterized damage-inducible protein DinB